MAAIGIDLGTTNSLVVHFTDDGPKVIPNALGKPLTPSVVGLDDDGTVLVGETARFRLLSHPDLTAARFKRSMGTDKRYKLGKRDFTAVDLSSLVLRQLKDDAESHLGEPVESAIISVPAYFNDVQRKATVEAGKLAGLKVDRLINEPTAAALAYGLQDEYAESVFLVIDLGGGTFDVSILETFDGLMEVRASSGDAYFGGEDFTDALVKHVRKKLDVTPDARGLARLREAADQLKHDLSSTGTAKASFIHDGTSHELTLTRDEFEALTEPLIRRLRLPIQRSLSDANLRANDLNRVILVGGATRMPLVRQFVTKLLGVFPEHSLDPDEVIALGAGVQAGLHARHAALDDVVMTDVSPFTLGLEVARDLGGGRQVPGVFSPIIERNSPLPISRVDQFIPTHAQQKSVVLRVFQGESMRTSENVFLGDVELALPANNPEKEVFDVRFTYDISGILDIEATILRTGGTKRCILQTGGSEADPKEVKERLKALAHLKIHPREKQVNRELLERLRAAHEFHLHDKRQRIADVLLAFEDALTQQNPAAIDEVRQHAESVLDWVASEGRT